MVHPYSLAAVVGGLFSNLFASAAMAQTDAAAPGGQAPAWVQMVPLVFMVGIFYFLILRPQQKREKQKQQFVAALKRGDEVVTATGLFGRVEGLTEQFVTLEISDGVRVKILRSAIASSVQALTQPQGAVGEANGAKGGKA